MLLSYSSKFYLFLTLGLLKVGAGLTLLYFAGPFWVHLVGVVVTLFGAALLVFSAGFYTMRELVEVGDSPLTRHFEDLKSSVEKSIDFVTKDPKTGRWKKRKLRYSNIGMNTPDAVRMVTDGEIEMFRIEAPPNISTMMVYVIGKAGTKIDSVISEHDVQYHILRGKMKVYVNGMEPVSLAAGESIRIPAKKERRSEVKEDMEGLLVYEGIDGRSVEDIALLS